MPELPEVESIRRSLEPRLLGRTVTAATLLRRDVLVAPGDPFGGFSRQRSPALRGATPARITPQSLLKGARFSRLVRRGKQLALLARAPDAAAETVVIVQLGMSGQLFHRAPGQRVADPSHIHAWWRLDDGSRLLFRDPRRFGALRTLGSPEALTALWASLGPDALTITPDELASTLRAARRGLKTALMDQTVIAGLGNIYVDEALFRAHLRPTRRASALRPDDLARLAAAIRSVLHDALAAGGSTLRDYVDAAGDPGTYQLAHAVYGRSGQPCRSCGRPLTSRVIAQRTTVWCRDCQH